MGYLRQDEDIVFDHKGASLGWYKLKVAPDMIPIFC